MLHKFSIPTDAMKREDKKSRGSKRSLAALSVSVIAASVFFAVLLYSIRFANDQARRVYASLQDRTQLLQELAFIDNVADVSFEDHLLYSDIQVELSTASSLICTTSKQDATTRNIDAAPPHPDDSAAEVSSEQKNVKTSTVKARETSTPSTTGSSTNNKTKVTPFSHKSKGSGQKHFGVGLRFTI